MDSLTQLVLGAAVGEAAMGRKVGNKAVAWGAFAGTLPDLDVFIPLGDAVSDFTYHRSASHSLLVLALLTPVLVWLINKLHPQHREHSRQWAIMIYLVFATHVLLDSLTAYGTQILWPFITTPVAWSSIFIIDPLYTLPLLVGVIAALVMTRHSQRGHLVNRAGLFISTVYLAWTLTAKFMVQQNVEQALQDQAIEYRDIFTVPTPFNSLLWRAVVKTESGHYESYYSVLDADNDIKFHFFESDEELLTGIENEWTVQRLKWFSRGFFAVRQRDKDIIISDLRMGVEPDYVFRFKVAEVGNPHAMITEPVKLNVSWDMSMLDSIWRRIFDESVEFEPSRYTSG